MPTNSTLPRIEPLPVRHQEVRSILARAISAGMFPTHLHITNEFQQRYVESRLQHLVLDLLCNQYKDVIIAVQVTRASQPTYWNCAYHVWIRIVSTCGAAPGITSLHYKAQEEFQ